MDLDDLRSFVEALESGGINRAAERLGTSKSMVSRRIARLEADLGVRLLNRTARGISPTEAGLELKLRGERILGDIEDAREAIAQQNGGLAGVVRLTAPLSFGTRHVAPVIAELARAFPRLEFDTCFTDRTVDLVGERFDLGVRIGNIRDTSLVARKLAPARGGLFASPDYIAARGRPQTPADLAGHDCLIYTGVSETSWVFRAGKRSFTFVPRGRLRSDSGDVMLRWVIDGLGICLAPTFLASDAVAEGRVEHLLADYALPESGVYVVRPPGPYVPGKVRVVIDALVERFGGEQGWDAAAARPM